MSVTLVYEDDAGVLQTVRFDAVLRELHTATAVPTEHTMESGVDLSDHVRPERARLSLDGFVTNTPTPSSFTGKSRGVQQQMQFTRTERATVSPASVSGGRTPPIRIPGAPTIITPITVRNAVREDRVTTVAGNVFQFPTRFDRVREVYDTLELLRRTGTSFAVYSYLREYDSMVITSMSAPKEAQDAITFALELIEVRFADTETIDAPAPREKRAQKTKPQGPKATYEAPTRASSIARNKLLSLAAEG